jgi:hypothetical protein
MLFRSKIENEVKSMSPYRSILWKSLPSIVVAAIAFESILYPPLSETYRVVLAGTVAGLVYLNGTWRLPQRDLEAVSERL